MAALAAGAAAAGLTLTAAGLLKALYSRLVSVVTMKYSP
jgi:hypothetical protein